MNQPAPDNETLDLFAEPRHGRAAPAKTRVRDKQSEQRQPHPPGSRTRKNPGGGEPAQTGSAEAASTDPIPTILRVPVHRIDPSPDHPRQHVRDADHEALVESLRTYGQDEAISLYPDGQRYRVRSGSRVWYAAQEAGLQELLAEIYPPVSRLEELRRIAREDRHERPRGAYERAILTGRIRAVLKEELGRTPTIRELAPELKLQTGATCERLRVYDGLTAEVVERAGASMEDLVALSHTSLHKAAVKRSPEERAAWLYHAIHKAFPRWWTRTEGPERVATFVARAKADGGFELDVPDPSRLSPNQATEILGALEPYIEDLRQRAEQTTT